MNKSVLFAQHVRDQTITEDEIMVSLDVVALFYLPAPFNFLVISGSQTPCIYLYLFE